MYELTVLLLYCYCFLRIQLTFFTDPICTSYIFFIFSDAVDASSSSSSSIMFFTSRNVQRTDGNVTYYEIVQQKRYRTGLCASLLLLCTYIRVITVFLKSFFYHKSSQPPFSVVRIFQQPLYARCLSYCILNMIATTTSYCTNIQRL